MDPVLDQGGLDFSQQSKGNFLFSAATTHSTMDFLAKVIEDGVVDSPPSHGHVLQGVSSPSPLRIKTAVVARWPSSRADSRSSQKLYESTLSTTGEVLVNMKSTISFVSYILWDSIVYANLLKLCRCTLQSLGSSSLCRAKSVFSNVPAVINRIARRHQQFKGGSLHAIL
jgi:hypothetical protein